MTAVGVANPPLPPSAVALGGSSPILHIEDISKMPPSTSPPCLSSATTPIAAGGKGGDTAAAAPEISFASSATPSSSSPSELSRLIDAQSWPGVLARLSTHPAEASVPIQRYHGPSLPLREALKLRPTAEVVRSLIEAYPPALTTPDPFSSSLPLHVAVQFGASLKVVEVLLEAHPRAARKFAEKEGMRLPIHLACRWGSDLDVVERLMWMYPESMHVVDGDGRTPLSYAKEFGAEGVTDLIDRARGYCAVSWATSSRMQEDFENRLLGTIAAHDAHISELNDAHAQELQLRDGFEEKLRSNLKLMKIRYTTLEAEIRKVSSERRRLAYTRRIGGGGGDECHPSSSSSSSHSAKRENENAESPSTKADELESALLSSMGRMACLLREADANDGDPRFVADVLEADLAAKTAQLIETEKALADSRERVDELILKLDEVLEESIKRKEEIRYLNETIEGLALCVKKLAVPRETLDMAVAERERALEVVERSRVRFDLVDVDEGGHRDDDFYAESVTGEGYIWQMGPSTRDVGRRENIVANASATNKLQEENDGKTDLMEEREEVGVDDGFSIQTEHTCVVTGEQDRYTVATFAMIGDNPASFPSSMDYVDAASLGDETQQETPAEENRKEEEDGDGYCSGSMCGEEIQAKNGANVVPEDGSDSAAVAAAIEDDKSDRGDGRSGGRGTPRTPTPAAAAASAEEEEDQTRKVLAIAENIDRSLSALRILLEGNTRALAALDGSTVAALTVETHRCSNDGAGSPFRANMKEEWKVSTSPGGEEEEIELIRKDTAEEDEGRRITCHDDAMSWNKGLYGCGILKREESVRGRGGAGDESTVDLSLVSDSNSIMTAWSYDGTNASVNACKTGTFCDGVSITLGDMSFFSR